MMRQFCQRGKVCSGDVGFEFRRVHRVAWLRFIVIFITHYRQTPDSTLDLYPDCICQLAFQFSIGILPFCCYNVAVEVPNASLNNQ